ncbi:MAG: 3-hydroxyacyl-CoA dehydrogenase [Desulfobacterales bacterium]|nr:3-hydroxyacyl-CoA dehydrogenase [Desulfobacterales bacterium]
MKIEDLNKILVIGAGTMGHQIGFLCALNGYNVVVYDINQDVLDKASERVKLFADKLVHMKRLKADEKENSLDRMTYTTDKDLAAKDADLITESVPEDPKMKATIFKTFNELCPERTIFTTNTSTLIPSMIAEETGRPEKFLAFHFHDIIQTDVVDIMPHPGTSEETIELVKALAEKLGQIVIMLKKENFGYVFNAMLSDFLKSAVTLASNKVASVEDIDRAWMGVMKSQSGPFGIMDSIGIDTVWKITDNIAKLYENPQITKNAEYLKEYVDNGKLGIKSSEGFYSYPDPKFLEDDFISKG